MRDPQGSVAHEAGETRRGGSSVRIFLALLASASPMAALLAARPFGLAIPGSVYLPLHTALESLVVATAIATFAVQWFAAGAGAFREARARFIGPAFLGAAILEFAHILNFPGMPGFFGLASTERGIAYWFAARYLAIGALVAAARIDRRTESPLLRRERVFAALLRRGRLLAAMLALVTMAIAVEVSLPAQRSFFFVEGQGLTPLKIVLEGALALLACVGALLHARIWRRTGDDASGKLALSLSMAALSETCFMLYEHAFDPFNLLGHAYLVSSFWFVFDALFVAALVRPYKELDALKAHVEDELVVTIERLRKATEQREDLLRAVSHDIRNPLQVVMLQTNRLLRASDEEGIARPASAILGSAKRMDRMLRDLTDSARTEAGTLELSRAPVNLRPFVNGILETSDGVLDAGRVDNSVPDDLPAVNADPDRLDRILMNLVGNALKYSKDRVFVTAARHGETVRVSVSDRGPGIAEEDITRIFERYYRGRRHEGEGLGLGLFIVRKLVEAHGGRIWAESRPGEGSVFTFTLPVAGGEHAARSEPE